MSQRVNRKQNAPESSDPGASLPRRSWSRSVAAVAVLRIIVVVVVVRRIIVFVAVVPLGAVDVDVGDVPAIIGPAPPREVRPLLAAVTVAITAIAAAGRHAANRESAVRPRLDAADSEHPSAAVSAAIGIVVAVTAVAAAEALLHRSHALTDQLLLTVAAARI